MSEGGQEGYDLGGAVLRLYGDRSALDRELEVLRRYTEKLEKQGITVKFDANTGQATRELDQLQSRLQKCSEALRQVQSGLAGDGDAWGGLAAKVQGAAEAMGAGGGAAAGISSALAGATGMALKAIPVLGQLGLAAQGVQAIFGAVTGAINGIIQPLERLAAETGRFNKQAAEAAIFATQAFAVMGPDGKAIQGTANQMRALRGTITSEFRKIQEEVAQISGATSSDIYEGLNVILQNVGGLGEKGEDIGNIRKLATRSAAAMNTLNIPGFQLRSEMQSLLTGNVQSYDMLANKLYGAGAGDKIRKLQEEGRYYDDLIAKLNKLYDGQKVLSGSLENIRSNYEDVFQRINSEGSVALERGLAGGFQATLTALNDLQGSFTSLLRSMSETLEPLIKSLGSVGSILVSLGSVIATTGQIALDVISPVVQLLGGSMDAGLQAVAQAFELVAKSAELLGKVVSATFRPIATLFRALSDQGKVTGAGVFDGWIKGLDSINQKLDQIQEKSARGLLPLANAIIVAQQFTAAAAAGRNPFGPETTRRTREAQAEFSANYLNSLDAADRAPLVSSRLSTKSQAFFDELNQRYGTGSQRQLQISKEVADLKEKTWRNEITALERGLQLMQAQKGVQEALNGLAEARRDLAMKQSDFLTQLATSPEARAAATDRRNELAAQQEQERIRERGAMLQTEKQLLQQQLEIQIRQARIQQESLKIQQAEILIAREKASAAARDAYAKASRIGQGTPEGQSLMASFRQANSEVDLRNRQLDASRRAVGFAFQLESSTRQITGLEARRLDIQGETLDVARQSANLTLEQQRTLSALAKEELQIKNQSQARANDLNAQLKALQQQQEALKQQQKVATDLERLEKSRAELAINRSAREVGAAERVLAAAQAAQRSRDTGSIGDWIEAQIQARAAGSSPSLVEATRQLNAARQRQLDAEQAAQRRQLEVQQQRERSELRIQQIQLQIHLLQSKATAERLKAEQSILALNARRDAMSGTVTGTIPGAPPAPVLPPPAGGGRGGGFGTLSIGAIKGLARAAGFNERNASIMAAIAMAESSGNASALNDNPRTGDLSYGLWQVNMIGRLGPERRRQFGIGTNDALYNPEINAAAAREIKASQGFGAWSVYRSGAYRAFLPAAERAAVVAPGDTVGATVPTSSALQGSAIATDLEAQRVTQESIEGQLQELLAEIKRQGERAEIDRQAQEELLAKQQESAKAQALVSDLQARFNSDPRIQTARTTGEALSSGIMGAAQTSARALLSGDTRTLKAELAQIMANTGERILEAVISNMLSPVLQQLQVGLLNVANPALMQQLAAANALMASAGALSAAAASLTGASAAVAAIQAGGAAAGVASAGVNFLGIASKAFGFLGGGFSFASSLALPAVNAAGYAFPSGLNLGLAGFRASGGPVTAGRPYMVGEQGPELFAPSSSGTILSASDTASLFQGTRAALSPMGSSQAPSSMPQPGGEIDVRYSRETINSVNYVTEEQFQKGIRQAAAQGRDLAYSGMQLDPRIRKALGIG